MLYTVVMLFLCIKMCFCMKLDVLRYAFKFLFGLIFISLDFLSLQGIKISSGNKFKGSYKIKPNTSSNSTATMLLL